MSDLETLKSFILKRCLHFSSDSSTGPQRLWPQSFVFDLRELTLNHDMCYLAANLIWQRIKLYEPSCLFTMGVGGMPLITTIQMIAKLDGKDITVLVCRPKRKKSNRKRRVEGTRPSPNSRAIFIDDLLNTGSTYESALQALADDNITLRVLGAAGILTMWSFRGTRTLEATGKVSEFLFRRHDFGVSKQAPTASDLPSAKVYIAADNGDNESDLRSPPVIEDSKVYWATSGQTIMCYDIATESLVWRFDAPHSDDCPKDISNYLAYDEASIFVNTYSGTTYSLNKQTGDINWCTHAGKWIHSSVTISSDNTKLYIGTEDIDGETPYGCIVALDKQTGHEIWKTRTSNLVPCTPHDMGDRIICGNNDNHILCLNPNNGNIWWDIVIQGPVKGKVNHINDRIGLVTENGYVYILDAKTGNVINSFIGSNGFRHNFLTVYGDMFITVDMDDMVKAFTSDGELVWVTRLTGGLRWNPTVYKDVLYLCNNRRTIYTVDPLTGEKLGVYNIPSELDISVGCPPALTEEYIAVNTNKGLLVYDFST